MATRDYTLGKGKITFLKDATADIAVMQAGGFTDLGNAPAFAVSLATEKLEHQSSRDGLGLVDMSVITKTSATGSFTLDEPNAQNLAYFFMDDAAATTAQVAGADQALFQDDVEGGTANTWIPLYKDNTGARGARVTDLVPGTAVVNALVEGTDFVLDNAAGMIMFMATPPATLTTFTVDIADASISTVEGFSVSQMKGWIFYVANPAAGIPVDVIGYCRISPTGDLALIGTDWTQMGFTVDFLKVEGYPIVNVITRTKV